MNKNFNKFNKVVDVRLDAIKNRGGRLFVCSDIHGNMEAFINLLNKEHFGDKDFMVVAGDCIDRGADGVAILQYIRKNSDNFLFIKGNHEELMIDAFDEMLSKGKGSKTDLWFYNGGRVTYDALMTIGSELPDLLNFVEDAPIVCRVVDGEKVVSYIAHAGLNRAWLSSLLNDKIPLDDNGYNAVTWAREEWWQSSNDLGVLTITGHTSTHHYDGGELGKPLLNGAKCRLLLDCCTRKTNKIGYAIVTVDRVYYAA